MFVVPRTTSPTLQLLNDAPVSGSSGLSAGRESHTDSFPNVLQGEDGLPPVSASPEPGMQKLLDAMNALGMSTAGLEIGYQEEIVGHPGGHYVNRMIRVTSGSRTEQFSAELTEKNPLVTAYEMQRYLGVPSGVGGTSGGNRS